MPVGIGDFGCSVLELFLFGCRQYTSQKLGDTPGLGDTSSRDIGRFGVEYLTKSANPGGTQRL
jgi:hypothetical protein